MQRIDLYQSATATMTVASEPGLCGGCGEERYTFVNRDGRTLCTLCDFAERHPHLVHIRTAADACQERPDA